MQHTQEPWVIGKSDSEVNIYTGYEIDRSCKNHVTGGTFTKKIPTCIATVHSATIPFYYPTSDEAKANACRIVACVNALAGVSTEWLEEWNSKNKSGSLVELLKWAESRRSKSNTKDIQSQRDELLAALREAREDIAKVEIGGICNLNETLKEIDSVIAKTI